MVLKCGLDRVGQTGFLVWFAVFCLGLLGSPGVVRGSSSISLVWKASPDTNVVGYRVYYGVGSRAYTNMVDLGRSTSVTISALRPGVCYYFTATAYNTLGLESPFSGEISCAPPINCQLMIQANPGFTNMLSLSARGDPPPAWRLEQSTDMRVWTSVASGTNAPIALSLKTHDVPARFFRLVAP